MQPWPCNPAIRTALTFICNAPDPVLLDLHLQTTWFKPPILVLTFTCNAPDPVLLDLHLQTTRFKPPILVLTFAYSAPDPVLLDQKSTWFRPPWPPCNPTWSRPPCPPFNPPAPDFLDLHLQPIWSKHPWPSPTTHLSQTSLTFTYNPPYPNHLN